MGSEFYIITKNRCFILRLRLEKGLSEVRVDHYSQKSNIFLLVSLRNLRCFDEILF